MTRHTMKALIPILALAMPACMEAPMTEDSQHELGSSTPIVDDMVETIGRSVHHLPLGVYSSTAARTFIAYPGCSNTSGTTCKVNPFLVVYDHTYGGYSTPIDLGKGVGGYPGDPDSHNYPSVVIDNANYLHVFFSRHALPMQHYVSKQPVTSDSLLQLSGWEERSFNASGQDKATYVMAFKDSAGEIYVFYRQSASMGSADCASGWYEPMSYVKSSNNGLTWSTPQEFLSPTGSGGWSTVYMKGVHHEQKSGRDRLHFAFAVTKDHNCKVDKVYYGYFNFANDRVYTPTGVNLGVSASASEWSQSSYKMELYADGVINPYFSQTAIGVDSIGKPTLFSTSRSNAAGYRSIDKRTWSGSSWSAPTRLFWYAANNTDPLEVTFQDPSNFDLYVRKDTLAGDTIKLDRHSYVAGAWQSPATIASLAGAGGLRYSNFAFVKNHPSNATMLRATYILGEYTYWATPQVGGMLFEY